MYRYDVINKLIEKNKFSSYLEVGVEYGNCFSKININNKIAVDIEQNGYTTHNMTSDEFFENNCKGNFDIIFIDALHTKDQVYKDITNAIKHLSPNGYVICHDVNPDEEWMTGDYREGNKYAWCGNAYKAFIKFRQNYLNYSCCTVDDDYGIGIITKGIGQHVDCDVDNLTFKEFSNNKKYLLNLISPEEFEKLFC